MDRILTDSTQGAAVLTRIGWLSRTPEDFQRAILSAAVWRRLEPDAAVGIAGDETGGIWGLAEGQINIISAVVAPDSPVADIDLPGSWAGFGPLFGAPRQAFTSARTPVLIATIPHTRIQAMVRDHPQWWQYFGQRAFEMTIRYGSALADLLLRDSRQRSVAVLLRLADCRRIDPPGPVTIVLAQDEFAAMANLSRHTSGEILRQLEADGLIALGYRSITVVAAAALRAIVDGAT